MADLKISQLTGATTPLTGAEVLPVVQSSTTKKVSVENVLNYGKINLNAVTAPTPTVTGTTLQITQADGVQNYITGYAFGAATNRFIGFRASGTNASKSAITSGGALAWFGGSGYGATTYANAVTGYMSVRAAETWTDTKWGTDLLFVYTPVGTAVAQQGMLINDTGVTAVLGNFVPAVAGKGVDFSANTGAAGKTSTLLNWYEEGTWTPTATSLVGSITSYTSSGTYTRIGRQVFLTAEITITSNGTGSSAIWVGGFPFTVAVNSGGLVGREGAVTGKGLIGSMSATATRAYTTFYDGTYPGSTNAVFNISVVYQCS